MTTDTLPAPISAHAARTTECWRVGAVNDLQPDDPCFEHSHEAMRYADAQSREHVTTVFGVWYYENGTEGNMLPSLSWLYFDEDSFRKES